MALKPTHRKALISILTSNDFDSPESMVSAMVAQLDELRGEDVQYITVREWPAAEGAAHFGTGPYATFNQAMKAIEKMRSGEAFGGKVAIVPTYSPAHVARRITETDTFPERTPGHWALLREKAGVA